MIEVEVDQSGKIEDLAVDTILAFSNGISGMLLILIWRRFPLFPKELLAFRRIGKKSPAHRVAQATYRGKRPAEKTVTEGEFIAVLK